MAKLALLLATLGLVLFLANATLHTTVTIDSEDNPWGRREEHHRQGGSCQQQLRDQNYLWHCQKYMEEEQFSGRDNARHLDSCCRQLEQLDRQCRCPGLKQALQQQFQGGERMGRQAEREDMSEMVERIMSKCEMEPRRCETPTMISLNSEENPRWREGSCATQIREADNLRHCKRYMEEQCRCSRREGGCNPEMHLQSCCRELENLDRQCRCPALKQVMQQEMQQGQGGRKMRRGEMQEEDMYRIADRLMSECNMEPRKCSTWF